MGIHGRLTHEPWDQFQGLLLRSMIIGELWGYCTRGLLIIYFYNYAIFILVHFFYCVGVSVPRLSKFERKNWRASYNSLVVLEHLLTHGPESVADEFQSDKEAIQDMGSFQHIDERGSV